MLKDLSSHYFSETFVRIWSFHSRRLEPEVAETVAMMTEAVGKFADEHVDSVQWDEDAGYAS